MRPIVEVMTVNFSLLALDQIVNSAAAIPHMSGGQFASPLVIRMTTGAGRQLAAQRTRTRWRAGTPTCPGSRCWRRRRWRTPAACSRRRSPTRNPVLIFEHGSLYNAAGTLPDPAPAVALAGAAVRRAGADVTIVA